VRTLALRLLVLLIAALPARPRSWAIRRLAWLRYRRFHSGTRPKAANIVERLAVTPAEAEQVLLRFYELGLLDLMDGWRMRSMTAETVDELVELRNLDHLDAALEDGQGAVISAGHVIGMHTFLVALGILGYAPHAIRLRSTGSKRRIARRIHHRSNVRLARLCVTMLWMEPGAFGVGGQALRALGRNAVVFSPLDVSKSKDNAVVDFFGSPAEFPRGLALLARNADAPLLDVFVYRSTDGRLVAEIGEPYRVDDVDAAVQHSAARLEEQVRLHPADWQPWHMFDVWRGLPEPAARV